MSSLMKNAIKFYEERIFLLNTVLSAHTDDRCTVAGLDTLARKVICVYAGPKLRGRDDRDVNAATPNWGLVAYNLGMLANTQYDIINVKEMQAMLEMIQSIKYRVQKKAKN